MSPEQALLNQLSTEISILHGSIVELSEAVSKLAESVPEKAAQDVPSTRSTENLKRAPYGRTYFVGPVQSYEIKKMMEAVSFDDFERSLRNILLMRGLAV